MIILSVSKTVTVNIVRIWIARDTNLLIAIACHKKSVSSTEFLHTDTADQLNFHDVSTKAKLYWP